MAKSTTSQKKPKEHKFEADVAQVLDIVIHALYSHPEIFLRELISNAADAIDQLRVRALTEHNLLEEGEELKIEILPDRENKCLVIRDNGVGMTRDELVTNLGTIARSGSREFLEQLKAKGQKTSDVDFIGKFGVGFYSSFLVARKVEVVSRSAGARKAHRWESEAQHSFSIEEVKDDVPRGTAIKLFLKEDKEEFLDEYRLRSMVREYSDFVSHPIFLEVEKQEGDGDDKTTVKSFERVNQGTAIWKRPKEEIEDDHYNEFYKHVIHDFQDPLARIHFTVEGTQMFTGLLFLPKEPPFDLFTRDQRRGVRLYVKRVFIMDDCEELVPEWLRFVRGVIDSDDLPLNVSRELLQEDRTVKTIRKVMVRKTLEMLEELAEKRPQDYNKFWQGFGAVLKEGLHYAPDQQEKLANLVRYDSSEGECVSLAEYVERMAEGQPAIYYVMAPDLSTAKSSPHGEALLKKGYEILYMADPVDEWAMQGLKTFQEKPLISAMKADLDLEQTDEEKKKEEDEVNPDLESFKDRISRVLEDEVSEVRLSRRLTESPACLVTPEGGMPAHIERMLRARQQGLPPSKRIFEINPEHPIVKRMRDLHLNEDYADHADEWVHLLYDQALLAEGSPIADSGAFAKRMSRLMTQALKGGDEETEQQAEQAS